MPSPGRPRRRPDGERPPFSWIGGELCLDFVNTVTWTAPDALLNERFVTGRDVVDWARAAGLLPGEGDALSGTEALLRDARDLRAVLHVALEDTAHARPAAPWTVDALDAWVRWAVQRLRLVPDDTGRWAWTTRAPQGSSERSDLDLTTAVLAPVIRSAMDLLRSPDLAQLRDCANPRCGWLFIDRSRKRNRRWCDMRGCGSHAKARRYYHRRRERQHEA